MDAREKRLFRLAQDLAQQNTDAGLLKAIEVLQHLINTGDTDAAIQIKTATYILQSSLAEDSTYKQKAIGLIEQAVSSASEDIPILEEAIHDYELILHDFPDKLDAIIRLCFQIINLDPDHVEAMIILSHYRENPHVALSLQDTISMLEWAQDIDPHNNLVVYNLFKLYTEAGMFQKAEKLYRQKFPQDGFNAPGMRSPEHIKNRPRRIPGKRRRKYGVN